MFGSLPMALTFARIAAIPLLTGLFYMEGDGIRFVALAVYAAAVPVAFIAAWLAFVAMTLMITPEMGWSWPFAIVAVVTGPFGGVLVWWRITRGGVPYRGRAVR